MPGDVVLAEVVRPAATLADVAGIKESRSACARGSSEPMRNEELRAAFVASPRFNLLL